MKRNPGSIILTRVGLDGGFSEVIGVCYDPDSVRACIEVDMEEHGTKIEDYKVVEWDV